MKNKYQAEWERFCKNYREYPSIGLSLDLNRMNIPESYYKKLAPDLARAFKEMQDLEEGGIANPDEGRMVGHYWLRNPDLAPKPEIRDEIVDTMRQVKNFANTVNEGGIRGAGGVFKHVLLIGIGGSALGPQFVADALGSPSKDRVRMWFFDNTDPDGMHRVIQGIGRELDQTLCVVVSKSGGTKETRNGMLYAKSMYESNGLKFANHAVAITQKGSALDKYAVTEGWIMRFPMWDWVGGRTSQTSAVGLLPAALQGIDVDAFLAGAREIDEITRIASINDNPAALLAVAWHFAGNGRGDRNMVVLPYSDRLALFAKYLQQLIMESLGKATDRNGVVVTQGITVFGNKGSTDQHSYIQQLRDGLSDFFSVFIEVNSPEFEDRVEVEPELRSSDFLHAFCAGTRQALSDNGRMSITLKVGEVSAKTVGVLIGLMERTVSFYSSVININAYNQPGVEAGKLAAANVLALQRTIHGLICSDEAERFSVPQLVERLPVGTKPEEVFEICEHLASMPRSGVLRVTGRGVLEREYTKA